MLIFTRKGFPENTMALWYDSKEGTYSSKSTAWPKVFVKLQVDSLKEMESTIILWANNLEQVLSSRTSEQPFLQPISRLTKLGIMGCLLFGNGTESPLKRFTIKKMDSGNC